MKILPLDRFTSRILALAEHGEDLDPLGGQD